MNKPNPGSMEAINQGCTCPVMDNAYGTGANGTSGDAAVFWINQGCPVHGVQPIDEIGRGDSVNG